MRFIQVHKVYLSKNMMLFLLWKRLFRLESKCKWYIYLYAEVWMYVTYIYMYAYVLLTLCSYIHMAWEYVKANVFIWKIHTNNTCVHLFMDMSTVWIVYCLSLYAWIDENINLSLYKYFSCNLMLILYYYIQ